MIAFPVGLLCIYKTWKLFLKGSLIFGHHFSQGNSCPMSEFGHVSSRKSHVSCETLPLEDGRAFSTHGSIQNFINAYPYQVQSLAYLAVSTSLTSKWMCVKVTYGAVCIHITNVLAIEETSSQGSVFYFQSFGFLSYAWSLSHFFI